MQFPYYIKYKTRLKYFILWGVWMDKYKVIVSAGLPTSIRNVAYRIAQANNWEYRPNPFSLRDWDYLVYVSDPRLDTLLVSQKLPADHVIVYLVSEGPIITRMKNSLNRQRVVVPTEFVKKMAEIKGIKVEKVIPHGIEIPDKVKSVYEKNGYFYRAYYLDRKYPKYGLQALDKFVKNYGSKDLDIYLVGTPFNRDYALQILYPFMKVKNPIPLNEMKELYDNHLFYLNFSDAEGFGLTPLEAMSYGEIVITSYYPAIRDYINVDCNIVVGIKGYWYERLDYEYILHAEYDSEDFYKAMEIAYEMSQKDRKTLEKMSNCNIEIAKKYNYLDIYREFAKMIEELAR